MDEENQIKDKLKIKRELTNARVKKCCKNILKKYHVFAPMGRFQLELIYLYFPPSSNLLYVSFKHTYTRWDDGGK